MALRGESEPLDVDLRQYAMARTADGVTVTVVDVDTSREWLTAFLAEFVVGRPFHLQSNAAVLSRLLV